MALPNGSGGYQLGDGNLNEVILGIQGAPIAKAAAATLTAAELANGIINYNGTASNLTVPLGTDLDAAFGCSIGLGGVVCVAALSTYLCC